MKKYLLILLLVCPNAFAINVSQSTISDLSEDYIANKTGVKSHSMLALEYAFDDNQQARDDKNEFYDSGLRARFNNNFNFGNGVSLNANFLINRFDNSDQIQRRANAVNGGGDRAFENIGVAFREFNIAKNGENYALIAGKFNLNFGSAWKWNRGIWIHNIANGNYRQVEKLGFVGIYRAGDAKTTGRYNFTFSPFTNDRKNFDNSLLTNRTSSKKSEAKAGDDRSLKSYVAMVDVNFDFGEKEKLSYKFSYLNLAVNKRISAVAANKIEDQKDFLANIEYQYPFSDDVLLEGLLEYVEVTNLNGNSDVSEKYLTVNLVTKFNKNWSVLLGNSRRQNFQLGADGFDQNLTEISLGYEFKKNSFFDRLTIQSGYQNFRDDRRVVIESTNSIGFLMRYYKNF